MYKAMLYDAPVSDDVSWRIMRVRLFLETGQPFEYIDQMSMADLGDIATYQSVKAKVEKKQAAKRGGKKAAPPRRKRR